MSSSKTRTGLLIFLIFFLLYSSYIHWSNWNENAYLALTKSIVANNSFSIDQYFEITGDRAYHNGSYYAAKEPGVPFFSAVAQGSIVLLCSDAGASGAIQNPHIPKFVVYTDPGACDKISMVILTIFTASVPGALTVLLVYKMSLMHGGGGVANAVAVVVGISMMLFPYSLVYFSHALSAFIVFLAAFFLYSWMHENKRELLILAFVLMGVSIVVDIICVIPVAILVLLNLRKLSKKEILLALASILLGAAPLLAYNLVLFGSPISFARAYMDPEIWQVNEIERETLGFGEFRPAVLFKSLFDPYRGLFYYYPVMLLAFIPLMRLNGRSYLALPALMIIATAIMLSFRVEWHGGASFASRYFAFITPFMYAPLLYCFSSSRRGVKLFVIITLIMLSVFSNIVGLENWEWVIGQDSSPGVSPEFEVKFHDLSPLPNVLETYYLPMFVTYGPRSRIVENLANGVIGVDIRDVPLSLDGNFPFSAVDAASMRILNFMPLIAFSAGLAFLFKEEISKHVWKCG